MIPYIFLFYWRAAVPFSKDGEPIVGELASFGLPGTWILSGLGAHGIMDGPMLGKVVAEEVARSLGSLGSLAAMDAPEKSLAAAAEEGDGGGSRPEGAPLPLAEAVFEAFAPGRADCVKRLPLPTPSPSL